jgi:hypothetical protein
MNNLLLVVAEKRVKAAMSAYLHYLTDDFIVWGETLQYWLGRLFAYLK